MMKKMVTANTVFGTNGTDAGGLSALLMPVKASPLGLGVIGAGIGAIGLGNAMVKNYNRKTLGKVTYTGGPARMTKNFTSGAVPGVARASGGNPEIAAGMFKEIMTNDSIAGKIQNYGVDSQFLSAFYGM
jgi:hypothetical protein